MAILDIGSDTYKKIMRRKKRKWSIRIDMKQYEGWAYSDIQRHICEKHNKTYNSSVHLSHWEGADQWYVRGEEETDMGDDLGYDFPAHTSATAIMARVRQRQLAENARRTREAMAIGIEDDPNYQKIVEKSKKEELTLCSKNLWK